MKQKRVSVVAGALVILILVILAAVRLTSVPSSAEQETQTGDLPVPGQVIAGFVVEDVEDFPEAKGTIITFRHEVSGATLCYIQNEDTNRAFSIGYRTPMADESDINHVFEHSILASSEKYPSHTLIYDLMGKTYSTYVNAFTYQTFTMYPVASQSEEQLRNMADVILSCMVSPGVLTDENFFKREALRYTLSDPQDDITMSGTVFTEDLSYMTDIGGNARNNVMDTLYPGEYASNMIGRAWENYRELTYDKVMQLYERCYHFDNALLLLYGDLDYESFLTFLDSEYLSQEPNNHTDLSTYDQPSAQFGYKEVECYAPAYEGDSTQDASVLYYAFDLDGQNMETLHQYSVLCDLLNANDSVLQQNMKSAGLGNATASLAVDALKPVMMFGLDNADPEDAQTFRRVVEDTLASIAADGLDSALVERALKVNRFAQYLAQESDSKAIEIYFTSILVQWAADGSTDYFAQEQSTLDRLAGPEGQALFRQLAGGLQDCTNTALVTTVPQPGLAEQIESQRQDDLAQMKASMSEEELNQLIRDTQAYESWAEEDVTNDDFTIPVSDLPDPAPQPEYNRQTEAGITYYSSDVGTEGIAYNKLLLDASGISREDLQYLDLYLQLVGSMGTEEHSTAELEGLKQEYLNGFWIENYYPTSNAGDFSRPYVRITWINDPDDQEKSLNLLLDLFQNLRLDDRAALLLRLDALLAERNPARRDALDLAQTVVGTASGRNQEYGAYLTGAESYEFLSELRQQLEDDPDALQELQEKMNEIGQTLCQRDHMISMLVTAEGELKATQAATRKILEVMPSHPAEVPDYDLPVFLDCTGIITEESLCYTYGEVYLNNLEGISGVIFPYLMALSDQYLLPELRYPGWAYSAECSFADSLEQVYVYSYADQRASASVEVIRGMADALEQMELTQEQLDGYIISAYSIITTPSTDTQEAINAMTDDLRGFDVDQMNRWIREVKTTTVEDQQDAVAMLRILLDQMKVVTVGNSAILNTDADEYDAVYDYRQS